MILFLDTEFTDFTNDRELISVGLVSLCGMYEFYREVENFDKNKSSEYVKEVVIPLLGKDAQTVKPRHTVREELSEWLDQFKHEHSVIAVDYEGDWLLFSDLVGKVPPFLKVVEVFYDIDVLVSEQYYRDTGQEQHHALNDAKANRVGFLADYKNRKSDGKKQST